MNPRQATFVKKLSQGYNKQDAAVAAGYSPTSASAIASQLIRKTKIIKALDRIGLTDRSIARGIKTNVDSGMGVRATADTSLRGLELASKLKGHLDTSNTDTSNTYTQTNIYIQELKALDNNALDYKLNSLIDDINKLKAK